MRGGMGLGRRTAWQREGRWPSMEDEMEDERGDKKDSAGGGGAGAMRVCGARPWPPRPREPRCKVAGDTCPSPAPCPPPLVFVGFGLVWAGIYNPPPTHTHTRNARMPLCPLHHRQSPPACPVCSQRACGASPRSSFSRLQPPERGGCLRSPAPSPFAGSAEAPRACSTVAPASRECPRPKPQPSGPSRSSEGEVYRNLLRSPF